MKYSVITTAALTELGACDGGMQWWTEHFPAGIEEYEVVLSALWSDGQHDYARWLEDNCGRDSYTFEELGDRERHNAIGALTDDTDYSWLYYDFFRAGEMIGVEFNTRRGTKSEPCIWWSGFYHQGSGLGFDGRYCYAKGAPKAVAKEWPQDSELLSIATALQEVQRRNFYRLYASIDSVRAVSIRVSVEDGENPYKDVCDAEEVVRDALQSFANWMYQKIQDQYEYETSEESISMLCLDNNYRFDKHGALL